MSTTFGTLKTRVSALLQDPDLKTFTEPMTEDLILAALAELGRIAPEQFTEDLTPVANQLTYPLRNADFNSALVPEIELVRVEVWDASQSPEAFIYSVPKSSFGSGADSGYYVWNGNLTLPTRTVKNLVGYEADYVIRVWGYSPYVAPDSDGDVIDVSTEVEQAMLDFIWYEALKQLVGSRNLFTQWQTRSGNTDMSPAALMSERNYAGEEWRRKSRAIARLRGR